MFQINFYHYFSHTGFIQPLEPHNNNNNESYYKQILTEREDVILRETQCDNYYQSGMKVRLMLIMIDHHSTNIW